MDPVPPMLVLYILVLAALAWFTAYTRNFQRTVVTLGGAADAAGGARLIPARQRFRTMAVLAAWPGAVALGLLFVAWWKAVALAVGAFLVLVPVIGSFTPRAGSAHYVRQIRADLERRIARGGRDAPELREILERLDRLTTGRT
jgi:hypothetical protein